MRRGLTITAAAVLANIALGIAALPSGAQVPPDDTASWGELIGDTAEVGAFARSGQGGTGGSTGGQSDIVCELHQVATSGGLTPTSYAELQSMYDITGQPIPVVRTCTELPATILPEAWLDWTPADGNPVDPALLAEMAKDRLRVPAPAGDVTPSLDIGTQAQMPTYFWLDNWPAPADYPSASASAGGVTVTAVATPISHTWWIRDSNRGTFPVRCGAQPGAAYAGTGPPPDGACSWTPEHSSAGQSRRHPVTDEPCFDTTVTVVWNVTWSGGDLGNIPTHADACIVVHEIQAVVSSSP